MAEEAGERQQVHALPERLDSIAPGQVMPACVVNIALFWRGSLPRPAASRPLRLMAQQTRVLLALITHRALDF